MLFDSHCHLQDERLAPVLDDALARARAAGVGRLLCCGVREADWEAVLALARERPGLVVPSLGLHPWCITGRLPGWLDTLERLLVGAPCGVGEIGLDRAIEPRDDSDQEDVFLAQLRLARRLGRPVSIHCRKAWGRMLELLRQEGGAPHGGAIHSYSGAPDSIPALESMGFHISFSGAITRPGNLRGHLALAAVSPDRLLIETDSPDLAPAGWPRERPNEPANLAGVLRAAAEIRGAQEPGLADRTWTNAMRCFRALV